MLQAAYPADARTDLSPWILEAATLYHASSAGNTALKVSAAHYPTLLSDGSLSPMELCQDWPSCSAAAAPLLSLATSMSWITGFSLQPSLSQLVSPSIFSLNVAPDLKANPA